MWAEEEEDMWGMGHDLAPLEKAVQVLMYLKGGNDKMGLIREGPLEPIDDCHYLWGVECGC
jgi:hypothetical protein